MLTQVQKIGKEKGGMEITTKAYLDLFESLTNSENLFKSLVHYIFTKRDDIWYEGKFTKGKKTLDFGTLQHGTGV